MAAPAESAVSWRGVRTAPGAARSGVMLIGHPVTIGDASLQKP